jgi:hypothetical protein
VPSPRALARALALLGACALAACERGPRAWHSDLRSDDPWHRRVAAQALRTADDDAVETHLRWLLLVLEDPDPAVAAAARESFEHLAPRAPPAVARLLRGLPADARELRQLLLGTLRRLAESGDEEARRELVTLLRAEAENADPRRARLAREWLERFE